MNLTITLQDALNGFDISFPHLDGHNVRDFILNNQLIIHDFLGNN